MHNLMTIKAFVEVAQLLPPTTSILIRGDHGLGKSGITRMLAEKFELPLMDRRIAHFSDGDMIGLPAENKNGHTRFSGTEWFHKCCVEPHLLFLDEINRGVKSVMNSAFEIVLDRRLNDNVLHPQTRVFAAINMGAFYSVTQCDPAFFDRFYIVDLAPSVEEWIEWSEMPNDQTPWGTNVWPLITKFFRAGNEEHLEAPDNTVRDKITPSRRSWHFVSNAVAHSKLENAADTRFTQMCAGFVGPEAAIAFGKFVAAAGSHITGEDVLTSFSTNETLRKRFDLMQYAEIPDLIDKVVKFAQTQTIFVNGEDRPGLSRVQLDNLREFATALSDEHLITLWAQIGAGMKSYFTSPIHKTIQDLLLAAVNNPGAKSDG